MSKYDNPKSVDGLMRYLRDIKGIKINGSAQKRKLRNIGYYHGFKGYRYINTPSRAINYSDFNQLMAVYDFDMRLKALLYPQIMFIETAIKNYVLEIILEKSKSGSFNDIYHNMLNGYKSFPIGTDDYVRELKRRLGLRDSIHIALTKNYSREKGIIQHFYHKDSNVPIWAIFEILSLGEFGVFVQCLDITTKQRISKDLGLHMSCDSNGKLTSSIIYTIKDLRNAVAHNEVIFDTRFRSGHVGKQLIRCLELSTTVTGINFGSIADYFMLITYLLKNLKVSKTELQRFVNEFESACEGVRKQVPFNIYSRIIPTDTSRKLAALKSYVKK